MITLSIIFIIFPVILGWAWWVFFVIRPIRKALDQKKFPTALPMMLIMLTLSLLAYALLFGGNGIYSFFVAVVSPPVNLLLAIWISIHLHFAGIVVSFGIILVVFSALFVVIKGRARVGAAVFAQILLLVVPIVVQRNISTAKLNSEYIRLNADCLSAKPFLSSLFSYSNRSNYFHAVALKGEDIYNWSYREREFVLSDLTMEQTRWLAPTSECRNSLP